MSEKAPKDQEQRLAEAEVAEFKADLGPFVVAAESTRMPMVFTDAHEADHPIIFANEAFLKLTGYHRDEVLAQPFGFLRASPSARADRDQRLRSRHDRPQSEWRSKLSGRAGARRARRAGCPVLTKPYGDLQLVTVLTALLVASDTATAAAV